MSTGLFGGAFDPPHCGHVALVEAAKRHFGLGRIIVLVAARPGHKAVETPAGDRLALARAAFPDEDVRLDEHERTVDLLRAGAWDEPLFLIGADQFLDFPAWKEPQEVLGLARLGVATRPGYPRERLDDVLRRLDRPERVEPFEIERWPVSSRELRARLSRGESVEGLVPRAVADEIEKRRLYRGS